MNTYYIAYEIHLEKEQAFKRGYIIRQTENNMETYSGLMKEIEVLNNEVSGKLWICFWKKLENNVELN